ncbi:3-deoxy-8-phosphooctulonate synthase [Malaciobacter mytili]|uniref:3-deoxy-8-phosphooctulonate synthase n=1 Tax=Malaciobacter mytili LMG 24559 TaxID=1032238 RepID=A0AAX2ABL9_9BACT|nr:3-deoxy-8-phosphooctulonate synthase [Malaciobacter mytili]AXH15573.1 3-deoxy-D-manno-octulosonate 8-phosphate synthase [Malaciobacter mytili LMG 24559]RXI38235.1 3-deoxy-8-phosphooctulonate synthase [Malaciobacter mytili]RXK12946.1 3-deoxy-8-phosphooctulonate synthase [Malaciobacter mytili LMG 24559]
MIILTGPCVLEDRDTVMQIAEKLKPLSEDKRVEFYFKASFDKANRTSISSYRGPGLDEGLKIFEEIKKQFGYKLITDIHESYQAKPAAEVIDILQIPAFLCRQTDLLVAAAKTNAKINIKKGQFLAADSMKHPVQKVLQTRGVEELNYQVSKDNGVWLCERGNTFGYGALVVDMRNLILMREYAPVIFDATHSVQIPSTGGTTGGNSDFVPYMAKAAAAVGVDGFFFETHINPSIAKSDGPNMLQVDKLYKTVEEIFAIKEALKN